MRITEELIADMKSRGKMDVRHVRHVVDGLSRKLNECAFPDLSMTYATKVADWTEYLCLLELDTDMLINPVTKMTTIEEDFCRAGQKITAIKMVRERTKLGLKEAKDIVDAAVPSLPPPRPAAAPPLTDDDIPF